MRPPLSDWETVFSLSEDPTPGDPEILDRLASEYRSISRDADSAYSVVARLESHDLGEGKSMDELRKKLAELPVQVRKLQTSYEAAADAVSKYATRLREGQDKADRALDQGRVAKEKLDSATLVAAAATGVVKGLDNAKAPPPDDDEARSSARRAMADAKQEESAANKSVENADAELEAARMLAVDAQELRVTDAGLAKRELEDAESEAVEGKSIWEKFLDIMGMVFGIVGAILGVIATFITGPVGLILAVGSFALGAASLGITVGKAIKTGNVDIAGIILGVVGLAFGGFSIASAVKGLGGLSGLKGISAGQWFKGSATNPFKSPGGLEGITKNLSPGKLDAPQLPKLDFGGGAAKWADDTLGALKLPKPAPIRPAPTTAPPPAPNITPAGPNIGAWVDGTSLGATAAGVIYTPISFVGKSDAAVQAPGDFDMQA
ncbi:hypothetical protein [Streptomyces sp. HNM0574]|uniref:hypothetical protein n=1 Tax=Streptomyces sp. HNM0574 TaxID=2714954 RepID=UPI00146B59A7|nr:hypothetical protein [Streptomyces sp. HNM0574]NLU66430.1 hypothetical protein [Streptomyces sp. HNM0574]